MSEPCRRWRTLLGSHALGLLGEREAVALGAHVDGCPSCLAELEELRRTSRALLEVDVSRLAEAGDRRPQPDLRARIDAQVRRERRRRLVAAAALAVAFAVAVPIAALRSGDGGDAVTRLQAEVGVRAEAQVIAKPWGSEIRLTAAGLDAGQTHAVWLERADGSRVPAGTFVAVGGRTVRMVLAAGVARAEAVAVGVTRLADDRVVARAAI